MLYIQWGSGTTALEIKASKIVDKIYVYICIHTHIYLLTLHIYTYQAYSTVTFRVFFSTEPHPGTQDCLRSLQPLKVALERSTNWEYLWQSIQLETSELLDYQSWCESREIWKSGVEREGKEKEGKDIHKAVQDVVTGHILGHSNLIKIAE